MNKEIRVYVEDQEEKSYGEKGTQEISQKQHGPYPGITYDDYNKLNINEQIDLYKFLQSVAQYYTKREPEKITPLKNVNHGLMTISQQQSIQIETKKIDKLDVIDEDVEEQDDNPTGGERNPDSTQLNYLSRPFMCDESKHTMQNFPKHPIFIDINKFTLLYSQFVNFFHPQTESDYLRFPGAKIKQNNVTNIKSKDDETKQICSNTHKFIDKHSLDDLDIDLIHQPISVLLTGHVDQGKSTLCRRLAKDQGQYSDEDILKLEDDCRTFGNTYQCLLAQFRTNTKKISLFDASGFRNYLPAIIQGYRQADAVCLVVSAKEGEFESGFENGGYSRQQVQLASELGVKQLIVIITKMDTIRWNQQRFDMIVAKITELSNQQFAQIHVIPVDALSGQNIIQPVDQAICSWYSGSYLVDLFDKINVLRLKHEGPLRIPVMDIFKDQDKIYIYGKLESGLIREGMECFIYPRKIAFIITSLYNYNNQRIKYARDGENLKIEIDGIDWKDIQKGMIICDMEQPPCLITSEFQARLILNELPNTSRIISAGYLCTMHLHSLIEEVQIVVEAIIDPKTKNPVKQNFLKSMQEGIVRITTKSPICLEKFDIMPNLGSFVLRSEDKIIGLGDILKVKPLMPQ